MLTWCVPDANVSCTVADRTCCWCYRSAFHAVVWFLVPTRGYTLLHVRDGCCSTYTAPPSPFPPMWHRKPSRRRRHPQPRAAQRRVCLQALPPPPHSLASTWVGAGRCWTSLGRCPLCGASSSFSWQRCARSCASPPPPQGCPPTAYGPVAATGGCPATSAKRWRRAWLVVGSPVVVVGQATRTVSRYGLVAMAVESEWRVVGTVRVVVTMTTTGMTVSTAPTMGLTAHWRARHRTTAATRRWMRTWWIWRRCWRRI